MLPVLRRAMASNCVAATGLMRWRARQSSARYTDEMPTGYTKIKVTAHFR